MMYINAIISYVYYNSTIINMIITILLVFIAYRTVVPHFFSSRIFFDNF